MKNLSVPEVKYNSRFDISIKPFLTPEEIKIVGEMGLKYDNYIEKKLAIGYAILRLCTDIKKEDIDDLEDYVFLNSGLYDEVVDNISNFAEVNKYIKYAESVDVAISRFLNHTLEKFLTNIANGLTTFANKVPENDQWEQFIKSLPKNTQNIIKTFQENGNAEIIKNVLEFNKGNDNK